jgi:hypothetical protein
VGVDEHREKPLGAMGGVVLSGRIVILSKAKEPKPSYGSFASLRMTDLARL